VHAGIDQVRRQAAKHFGLDAAVAVDGGDQIGKDAVEGGHLIFLGVSLCLVVRSVPKERVSNQFESAIADLSIERF
jgi:hypothetical protein